MSSNDLIGKLVRQMLSSDQQGEVFNAVRKFKQSLEKIGLDIHGFADAVGRMISMNALQPELSHDDCVKLATVLGTEFSRSAEAARRPRAAPSLTRPHRKAGGGPETAPRPVLGGTKEGMILGRTTEDGPCPKMRQRAESVNRS
jgi:hypothetical protein